MFLGFGFHHEALRELTIPMASNLCRRRGWCVHTCALEHVCMCAHVHNVYMNVIIQASSKILFLVFIRQTRSVCLWLKQRSQWC